MNNGKSIADAGSGYVETDFPVGGTYTTAGTYNMFCTGKPASM